MHMQNIPFPDSNRCKREGCSTTPLGSTADKPPLHTSNLHPAFHGFEPHWRDAARGMHSLGGPLYNSYGKPYSQRYGRGYGKVKFSWDVHKS